MSRWSPAGLLPAEPWVRNQHVTVAAVFAVFTGFAFVLPFLPLYVRQLGVEDAADAALWAGVLIGVAPLLAGLLAPVWGRLADRYGHKRIALKALLAYVVLLVLSAAVTSVWQLLALRAGIGLFGGIGPLGLAMVTLRTPPEHTGRALGAVQAAQILSAAVGPLMGGVLADTIGIRRTFLATAALCCVALWLVWRHYDEGPRPVREAGARAASPWRELMGTRGVLSLLAVLFLVNFIGRSFTPVLPLHLQELGVAPGRLAVSTGVLICIYSVAAALSAAYVGRASGHHSPVLLLGLALAGGAVSVLPMAWVSTLAPLLGLALLFGLASGGCLTLCYTIGSRLVAAERRATAFGVFAGAALFGGAVSPAVAGFLTRWELRAIYEVDAALFAALAVGALAVAAAPSRAPRPLPARPAVEAGPSPGGPSRPARG